MRSAWLWVILAGGAALRVALLMQAVHAEKRAFTPDSWDYWHLAGQMRGQTLVLPAPRDGLPWPEKLELPARFGRSEEEPEIFRTPGYPGFLVVGWLRRQAGPELLGGWRLALVIQVLIDVHLIGLTFLLGRTLAGRGAGLVAAALQAVSPLAIAASCRVLSDSLYAFLLTAAVLLMLRHLRGGGWASVAASAVVLAAASYVRPVALAMAGVFAVVLLFGRRRFRRAGAFVGVTAALIAPWVVRNAVVADYVGFSSVTIDGLYYFSAAEVLAREQGISPQRARARLREEERRRHEDMINEAAGAVDGLVIMKGSAYRPFGVKDVGPGVPTGPASQPAGGGRGDFAVRYFAAGPEPGGGGARYRRRRALEIIARRPWLYARIHLTGCLAFWLPGATDVLEIAGRTTGGRGTLAVLHREGFLAAARHYFGGDALAMALAAGMGLVLLIRYAGVVLCGLWRARGRLSAAGWLCLLLVAAAFLLPGPAAHPRFRVPVEPILSVAAAAGWLALIGAFRRVRRGAGD